MTEDETIARFKSCQENTGKCEKCRFYSCCGIYDMEDTAIEALKEVQQYRQIGTVDECREAVEKQEKRLSVDEAKRIAAKAICIGCGYLTGYECSYNGRNCMISKPMLESVSKSFDDWNRRVNDGKTD